MILFDIGPVGGNIGLGLAIFVLLAGLAGAFAIIKLLNKQSIFLRLFLAGAILLISFVYITVLLTGGGGAGRTMPPSQTPIKNTP